MKCVLLHRLRDVVSARALMTADAVAPLRRRGISIALVAVFTSLARDFFSARACRARESADLCGAALFPHIPKKRCRSDGFAVALI